jgi:hypothetical protein
MVPGTGASVRDVAREVGICLTSMNTFADISLRSLKEPSRADPRIGQFFPIRGTLGT